MNRVVAIAQTSLIRLLRERANLFFVFVFPMLLVLLIGLSFGGGGNVHVLVVDDLDDPSLVPELLEALEAQDGIEASTTSSADLAQESLSRARVDGVLQLAGNAAQLLADGTAIPVNLQLRDEAQGARPAIDAALRQVTGPSAAASLARELGATDADAESLRSRSVEPVVTITTTEIGGGGLEEEFAGLGQFSLGASTQLLLFMFVTTLNGASRVVESRQLGVTRRALASPTSPMQVVLGEGLGRFAVALFQGAWVVLATLLLFQVDWGAPLGTLAVIASFGLASAGAGLLLGAVATNVNQAGGLGTMLGLSLSALGGCMAPLDIFNDTLRTIAHVTPHAWANDAFADLTRRDGGLVDVLPEVGVILLFAAVLGGLASWRLRVTITEA